MTGLHRFQLCVILITKLASANIAWATQGNEEQAKILIHYQQKDDSWDVEYQLNPPAERLVFSRAGNLNRASLFQIDASLYQWDALGRAQVIKRIDGKPISKLNLSFKSNYDFIQKDYTPNIKFTDGGVMFFTHYLTLSETSFSRDTSQVTDKLIANTQLHFFSPNQTITFLGEVYQEKAKWKPNEKGTYVFFGDNKAIEKEDLVAIVDTGVPKWVWENTRKYLPKLFTFYRNKTGQTLNFRPFVFLNFDKVDGEFSNYSGGTLPGLVQLSVLGGRWKEKNEKQFNTLFHFVAHESAHFWNGNMFGYEDGRHSWMHEGGADAFANFAMRDFGLLTDEEMLEKFEVAANKCITRKGGESLEESGAIWRAKNYYYCGAVMSLASHLVVKAKHPDKTIFDLWGDIFKRVKSSKKSDYNQDMYFEALTALSGSSRLSDEMAHFSRSKNLDNAQVLAAFFDNTEVKAEFQYKFPSWVARHWGDEIPRRIMSMHCQRMNIGQYDDFAQLYPVAGCKPFEKTLEVRYMEDIDIRLDGITAYTLFREKCEKREKVKLKNRKKVLVAEVQCLEKVAPLEPYLKFVKRNVDRAI